MRMPERLLFVEKETNLFSANKYVLMPFRPANQSAYKMNPTDINEVKTHRFERHASGAYFAGFPTRRTCTCWVLELAL